MKSYRDKNKLFNIIVIFFTLVMIILRFLLNEKGRVSPDSIRFMRFANGLPIIDNTTTPLGYPAAIRFFTIFGFDEFWSSKIVGLLSYFFIIGFAWRKQFYFRESVLIGGLFSFVSLYAATLSEALTLPFVFILIFIASKIINEKFRLWKGIFILTLSLIVIYNIRYSGLFLMGSCLLFGILNFRKNYSKIFILSALFGFLFIVLYKFTFIDTFNEEYIDRALEIGYYPTAKLLLEFFQGITTSFNPFVHMANPNGGLLNIGIYSIGAFTIITLVYLCLKNVITGVEKFMICIGVCGIVCSFFIQYFYVIDALDYRILSLFTFPLWLIFFGKLSSMLGKKTYVITIISLLTGFVFIWLSKGNYLDNRAQVSKFLNENKLDNVPIKFYVKNNDDSDSFQLAELCSTVNSNLTITFNKKDTLNSNTLTQYKILQKIKLEKNKYQ